MYLNMSKMFNYLFVFVHITMIINIVAWNVRGIMSSAVPLSHILQSNSIDISFISEHKLLPKSLSFLDSIHPI